MQSEKCRMQNAELRCPALPDSIEVVRLRRTRRLLKKDVPRENIFFDPSSPNRVVFWGKRLTFLG